MQTKNRISLARKALFGIMLLGLLFSAFGLAKLPSVSAQEGTPTTPTADVEGQIVGGALADPGEYPWQVALISGSATNLSQFCGGSLIHPQWVLTAAHCITYSDTGGVYAPSLVDVVAGVYDLTAASGSGYQRRNVIQIIRHPSYNRTTNDNDIALLKLESAVAIGGSGAAKTAIIPFASPGIGSLAGTSAVATGWGNTISYGNPSGYPTQLHEVLLPIYSNSVCNDGNHWPGYITDNMLCAGYDAGGHDVCDGDSGGPLIVWNAGTGAWNVAGIASFVHGSCAESNGWPGVFVRVSQYWSWINANLSPVQLIVNKAGAGSGTVTSSPAGINCGSTCSNSFSYNSMVTLTAVPAAGSMFYPGWSGGGCSGNNSTCTVAMTDVKSVTATFTLLKSYIDIGIWTTAFNYNEGWRVDMHPRMLGDVNGDGKDDMVGIGNAGVFVALANSAGNGFLPVSIWTSALSYNEGWRVDMHPRTLGDVNGDGKDDLIGFGYAGVFVALANSAGNGFLPASIWTNAFNYNEGWRVNMHPRMVGDVNGDGKADLIGIGYAGVFVALANSAGNGFLPPSIWTNAFNYNEGWRVNMHPRMVGDVNGDGRADLIGIGYAGVFVALANSTGNGFLPASIWTSAFNYNEGWRVDMHPRMVGDVNGDGKDDLIGFGYAGVFVALANSGGNGFVVDGMWTNAFNYNEGWRVNMHPRMLGDVNGDGKADLVGIGNAAVFVTIAK